MSDTPRNASGTSFKYIRFPRFTAALAIVLAAANLRTAITALAPLISPIQDAIGLSSSLVGVLGTIPTAMFALSAFVLPRMKEKMTLSEMMLVALGLTTLGQLLRVAYPHPMILLLGSVVALFAVGILNSTMPLVVREYFPNHVPGMSLTFMMTGQVVLAIAPMIAVPVMNAADARSLPGWQLSLGMWAAISFVAAIAWVPLLIRRGPNPNVTAPELNFRMPVWKTPVGLGMAFMFGCNSMVAYTMMTFLPQIFTDAGTSPETAAGLLALWTTIGIPVTLLGPWLAGRLPNVFPAVIVSGLSFLIGHLGLAIAPLAAPWLWCILSAVGTIVFSMAMVLVNIRARTLEGATALTSFGQGVGYTIASLGPLLTGFLYQVTGTFTLALCILASMGILMLVAGFFATRRVYVEDQIPTTSA